MNSLQTFNIPCHLFDINKESQNKNSSLVRLIWDAQNSEILYLPKLIFGWFPNLKEIEINARQSKSIQIDFWNFLNGSELQSIKLYNLADELANQISQIKLKTMKVFHIKNVKFKKTCLDLAVLQEFLKHNNQIKNFALSVNQHDFNEPLGIEILQIVMSHLKTIEYVCIPNFDSIMRDDIEKIIAPSTTLKQWEIGKFNS